MSTNDPRRQESTASRPEDELTLYERPTCSNCGKPVTATVINGPDAADRRNSPCGCAAEVEE